MRQSSRLVLFAGLVLVAGLLIYLPGLSGPLMFDDKPALSVNALVQISGTAFDEWRSAALSSESGPLRRPIAMLSFAANHVIEGTFSSFGLKAVNLGIHLAIASLLFFFCQRVLGVLEIGPDAATRRLIALLAASIWLLHPLNVSTVLYAVQRMAQLATLFVLGGLLVYMHYRQRWAQIGAPTGEVLAAALWLLLLTILATLSKENGALLPWLIVVIEVCLFRGVWAGRPVRWLRNLGWMALVFPILLVLCILAVSPDSLLGGYARREFSLEERLFTQARLLWRYLGWICVPNINDMGFQHDDIATSTGLLAPWSTALAIGAWLLMLVVAYVWRLRYPLLLLMVLFFLVGHAMESTVWPLEMVYEHRNYLPGMLVCLALACLIVIPVSRTQNIGTWFPVIGTVVVLCVLLFIRVQTWSDELILSRTNLAQHPESSRSNYFYANALLRHYRRSEQLGLSERERTEYLILSRHYFERMYQTNERDVAALVMLFYLDRYHFTEMQEKVDWLSKLEALLDTRTMQASDWNALATLFEIFAAHPDLVPEERVMGIQGRLSARYPDSVQLARYEYQYLTALDAEPEKLLPILVQARAVAPGDAWIHLALMREYQRLDDFAGTYESAGFWLQQDPRRYELSRIRALFVEQELPLDTTDE